MALTNDVMDAVNILGGIKVVARKLRVPEEYVKEWIEKGTMKSAAHDHVVRLSLLSGVSPEHLAPLGP
jgi:hypothetical protein